MGKMDLADCFYHFLVHPDDMQYLGILLEGEVRLPTVALFGYTQYPFLINMVMAEVIRIARAVRLDPVHFTDDYFVTGPSKDACATQLHQLQHLLTSLGFTVNPAKTVGPHQRLVFLGIEIDTTTMRLSIPQHRLDSICDTVDQLLQAPTPWRRTDVESIIGKLAWASTVMIAGLAHLKRLWYSLPSGHRSSAPVNLTADARLELRWWLTTLQDAATTPPWCPIWEGRPPITARVLSDASGAIGGGFGLVCNGHIVQGQFAPPPPGTQYSSAYLELAPVLWAVKILAPQLQGGTLVITTDNIGNVFALNKGACKSPQAFQLLHEIFSLAAQHHVCLIGDWIPRDYNTFTDGLSKWQFIRPAQQV